jgi:hypothetical protein
MKLHLIVREVRYSSLFSDLIPFNLLKVNGLHDFKYKKMELLITTAVRTSKLREIYLFASMLKLAQGSTQPPVSALMQPGCEGGDTVPSSGRVKNAYLIHIFVV